ncbi:MAG: NADH-quinone oxidoreductase subunit N [Clostridia bacterium]|nr:NADH-quinone oxidoreductase subunit N [Clostridia bacterium]
MLDFNFSYLTIEILTAILGIGLLILGLLVPKEHRKGFGYLTSAGLIGILVGTFYMFGINESTNKGMFIADDFSVFFKQLFLVAAILVTLAANDYVEKLEEGKSEFFALIVFATLGMMVIASAGDLITMFVGIELMTISFYCLVGLKKRDSKVAEAGIKYLLLGGVSSAVILYGLTLVYGTTGTTVITEIANRVAQGSLAPALLLGIIFLIAGFGFKISLVPFHMWSPDVYEGAPTPVTSFLATGSKAAAFVAFIRIFLDGMPSLQDNWLALFIGLAMLSIIIGNLVAIPQTNLKRMLAFSGVAQAGYLMTGMVAGNAAGVAGIGFYLFIYAVGTVGAFAVATAFYNATGTDDIKDMSGLAQRNPLMAASLLVAMLSMAGIPPLAGFAGKLFLFAAVVEKGYLWVALVGLVMSMMSVYYYLNVAKAMYMNDPVDDTPITLSGSMKLVLLSSVVVTLILGVWPTPLSDLALAAAQVLGL